MPRSLHFAAALLGLLGTSCLGGASPGVVTGPGDTVGTETTGRDTDAPDARDVVPELDVPDAADVSECDPAQPDDICCCDLDALTEPVCEEGRWVCPWGELYGGSDCWRMCGPCSLPCEDVADTRGDVADGAGDVGQSDVADSTGPEDTEDTEGVTDAADSHDAAEPTCDELRAEAEAELATLAAGCTEPLGCAFYEFPICGTFGCFQGAFVKGRSSIPVNAAAGVAMTAGCEPFHCGCGFPTGYPVCLEDTCRLCPPDCGSSCEDLADAIVAKSEELARGCSSDEDCGSTATPNCMLGPRIICHTLAHRKSQDVSILLEMLAAYTSSTMGCQWGECDCAEAPIVCDNGTCTPTTR